MKKLRDILNESFIPGLPAASKKKPTKEHHPIAWEGMLGTVHARNNKGESKYFHYNYEDAVKHISVDDHHDFRIHRNKKRPNEGTGSPRYNQLVVYAKRKSSIKESHSDLPPIDAPVKRNIVNKFVPENPDFSNNTFYHERKHSHDVIYKEDENGTRHVYHTLKDQKSATQKFKELKDTHNRKIWNSSKDKHEYALKRNIKEMNTAGSGAIAGIGINQDGSQYNAATAPNSYGEPGVSKKKQKEIKTSGLSPKMIRLIRRFQGKE